MPIPDTLKKIKIDWPERTTLPHAVVVMTGPATLHEPGVKPITLFWSNGITIHRLDGEPFNEFKARTIREFRAQLADPRDVPVLIADGNITE